MCNRLATPKQAHRVWTMILKEAGKAFWLFDDGAAVIAAA